MPIWTPENYHGLAALRRTCGIPITAGKNVHTLINFARLMKAGVVNFVQPGPAKAGGVSEVCEVYSIAAVRNVAVVPHSFYDGPGLLAAIHTTVALGTAETMIEWRVFDLEAQLYAGSDVADPTNFSTVMPDHSRPIAYLAGASETRYKTGLCTRCRSKLISLWGGSVEVST